MTNYLEKITDPLNQWYQTSSSKAFFDWWFTELKQLVPEKYRENLFPDSKEILISHITADDEVTIWHQYQGKLQSLDFDDSVTDKEWWHKLNHFVASSDLETAVTYLIDEEQVLNREIAMPVVVANDIESVLQYELDKYIPFSAEEVVYDFRKGAIEEGSEKFPVLLTAVKKQVLKEIIDETEAKGVQLSAVDVNVGTANEPEVLGVNLLPKESRKKKDWTNLKWHVGLVVAAVLMLGFVMFTSLQNKREKIRSLDAQVTELRKDARRAKLIETQLEESIKAANFLGNLKLSTPSRVVMLNELTQKIPENTFLTRIVVNEDKLEVVGESDNANALVPILNQSELWYEPQIIGNVTQGRTGKEKFTIKSELKPTEETDEEVNNGT